MNELRTRNQLITFFIKTHSTLATNCNTKELLCPQNVSLIMQIAHKEKMFTRSHAGASCSFKCEVRQTKEEDKPDN